jgi:hypothetical protein
MKGMYLEADLDFREALRICKVHSDDYYHFELLFWHCAACIELEDKSAALKSLALLPDDFVSFIRRPISKRELLEQCL